MLKIVNPATQSLLAKVSADTAASVKRKYRLARAAQPAWARLRPIERIDAMTRFREQLVARREDLANILTAEVGKPIAQSRNELTGVLARIDFFINNTTKILKDEIVFADRGEKLEEKISFEPLGVVANISAWNYPYFVGSNAFVPALLTGNAVLYKPSELTTRTGLALGELWHQAGVPRDVFQVLVGGGAVGEALLAQPLDGLFFTGSYATGKKIAEATAGRMLKLQLELGGKDPAYVAEDVDVAAAAASLADGAMYNAGQSCCSVERIYVHERIAASFIAAFLDTVRGFKSGDPLDLETYIGPLARRQQLELLEQQVADAVAKGGKVLIGG